MRSRCVCLCEINRNVNIKYIEKQRKKLIILRFQHDGSFLICDLITTQLLPFLCVRTRTISLSLPVFLVCEPSVRTLMKCALASIIATFSVIAPAMQLMNSCAILLSSWPIKENLNSQDFQWLDLWKPLAPPDTVFCINTEILQKSYLTNKKLIFNKNYECFAGFFKQRQGVGGNQKFQGELYMLLDRIFYWVVGM